MKKRWSKEDDALLILLRNRGVSQKIMGLIFNRTEKACECRIRDIIRELTNDKTPYKWDDWQERAAVLLRQKGCTYAEICKVVEKSENAVCHRILFEKEKRN